MLKIENVVLPSPQQWEAIIRGMRNPKNSWNLSDSHMTWIEDQDTFEIAPYEFFVGEKDLDLMKRLRNGGPVHAKYRRMIPVYLDITAPLYWWKEFDTYKLGTVANSCSTMHKIHAKDFTLDDFSCEKLFGIFKADLESTILKLNIARNTYVYGGDSLNDNGEVFTVEPKDKRLWEQMIQLLPSSYNQKRTIMLNYEVLANIYEWRRNHKLDEWHVVCDWIETLPYKELITEKGSKGPKIAYLCDKKNCGDKCINPDCHLTWDVEHAVNFEKDELHNIYTEKME